MKIGGFQKLSLLNYPDKTACTIYTSGCNFNCPWCHNSGLAQGKEAEIDPDSILNFLRQRKGLLDGVCISGGEPLIHEDIELFLRHIKQIGYFIKLDTNGSNPYLLEKLIRSRLVDYVAMDIKNTWGKYAKTTGSTSAPVQKIRDSVGLLKDGMVSYEFRTTVISEYHTAADIEEMAVHIRGASVWYLQPFRDAPEVSQKGLHAPTPNEMEEYGSIGNRFVMTMIRQ